LILLSSVGEHSVLHSFPTRRSSDLRYKLTAGGTMLPEDMLRKTTLLSEDDPEYKRLYEIMYKSPLHVVMQLMILTLSNQPTNLIDRKSTRLNSSHVKISYAVFCLKK